MLDEAELPREELWPVVYIKCNFIMLSVKKCDFINSENFYFMYIFILHVQHNSLQYSLQTVHLFIDPIE